MNSPDAQRCLDKAAECERRVEQAADDVSRNSYLRMAENWRLLAETHRQTAKVEKIMAGREKLKKFSGRRQHIRSARRS
jgi:hypothetical protein